jgi:1-deoxy-D-xylulose-5-phosphate reductoisomerase
LRVRLADTDIKVTDDITEAAAYDSATVVMSALSGSAGLLPTLAAIDAGKTVALANKETMVCAGRIVMARAREKNVSIVPVDSEHSAIFQCLEGRGKPKKLWLTASGGPFFGYTKEQLRHVTVEQALKHPNWSMGRKVTIDSATLFNKGLETIEAMRLFDTENVGVVVHRQSIVHSLVEFEDGALLAQCGAPDMRLPIQYALTYPARLPCVGDKLDMTRPMEWTFAPPDRAAFPGLDIALEAAKRGDASCAAVNAADEVAVAKFLSGDIRFCEIPIKLEQGLRAAEGLNGGTIEEILEVEREVIRCLA